MTKVAVTHHEDIGQSILQALGHLEVENLIRGKKVAIHPNDTWASPEDTTAVTQPESLRALLQYVKKFSPAELIVTAGSGAGESDEIFRIAGLMEVVERGEQIAPVAAEAK